MNLHPPIVLALLAAASLPLAAAPARDGKQVYDETCSLCHAQGRDGAPQVGDPKAWSKLSERGLSSLTESAITGVRKMPPHGGRLGLPDLELRRAIAYMVNQSGGKWAEPADRRRLPPERSGEEIVKAQCLDCHGDGRHGAPRMGDNRAWVNRASRGFDELMVSAMRGHGGMPARGGMANLSDAEVKAAVSYLVQASLRPPAK